MPQFDWQLAAEIATTVSTIAFAASAIVVVVQLRQAARERYFSVTAHLFEIWQSPEFQHDQLFLLHKLSGSTWEEFCKLGRGEHAERALHRVGGYYDRVGNLVRHGLIRKDDILPTVGGYAVAVWHRIQPLVKELRLRENAVLFENYERLLPECRECYVPGLESGNGPVPSLPTSRPDGAAGPTCVIPALAEPRSPVVIASAESATRQIVGNIAGETNAMAIDSSKADGAKPAALHLSLRDTDGIVREFGEFTASGPAVLLYVRGAWCPFCLRQLSDYGEQYREFKQSGLEVFAVSPESPRRSRRLRRGLKLPFTVLSDSRLEAAKHLDLIGHEKPGAPTPATLVLDGKHGVRLSSMNQGPKCLFARDVLEYMRMRPLDAPQHIPPPSVEMPKPGFLFMRGLANMFAGIVIR